MNKRPAGLKGLRHLALWVADMTACEQFYVNLLGMQIEWRPDEDNVYLTSGRDNLALHRSDKSCNGPQRLDHFGFILALPEQVDAWYEFLNSQQVTMLAIPKTHRDGARSFYCQDPVGNVVQFIFHPPISSLA